MMHLPFTLEKKYLILFIFGVVLFIDHSRSLAQAEPQLLVTWKASGHVPPNYTGKVLATKNSGITVSFDLVEQGRILDLSKQTISWYVNSRIVTQGIGMHTALFYPSRSSLSENFYLRVEVPYKKTKLLYSVAIPLARPEAVLEWQSPVKQFSPHAPFTVRALPYFFNVGSAKSLSFEWSANGIPSSGTESPDLLTVTSNAPTTLSLSIIGTPAASGELPEGARASLSLTPLQ